MTETLEKVRAKIIEAVPEIVTDAYCGAPCHCLQAEKEERPITLADVLRAIGDGYASELTNIDNGILFWKFDSGEPGFYWNLALPLDEQEPEVWDFFLKVLGV